MAQISTPARSPDISDFMMLLSDPAAYAARLEALKGAKAAADEAIATAQREAVRIVAEAETRAAAIVAEADLKMSQVKAFVREASDLMTPKERT
jgi:vacuolar-type H+-ATPase subunit H